MIVRLVQCPWPLREIGGGCSRAWIVPDLVTAVRQQDSGGMDAQIVVDVVGGGSVVVAEESVSYVSGHPGWRPGGPEMAARVAEVAAWVDAHRSVLPTIEVLPTEPSTR